MTISVERDFELATLKLSGRLDTTTAPDLETAIKELPDDIKKLVFDMSELEYISSAGIRVILAAYKKMKSKGGSIRIICANEMVRDVFDMTGLLQMLE